MTMRTLLSVTCSLVMVTCLLVAAPARAASGELPAGNTLASGASLRSADDRYQLVMQADGNAVVYGGSRALWASGTNGHPGALLAVQPDGNLVVYSAAGRALWASNTLGRNAVLAMQNDGNLVLYHGAAAVWASGPDRPAPTSRRTLSTGERLTPGQSLSANGYILALQADGNLVGSGPAGPGWSTSTEGRQSSHLVLQGDGNLVLYDRSGRALWASGTVGAVQLALQDDANLVLYSGDGRARWSRRLAFVAWSRALTSSERSSMTGVSWRSGCPVPLADLRVLTLTHIDFTGEPRDGVLVLRTDVVAEVTAVFGRLHAERFPIRQMVPIEAFGGNDSASTAADNTSAFNCRPVTGGTSWSRHSYGSAIDINPVENPYVTPSGVMPPAGRSYVDRSQYRPGMLMADGTAVREFEARGWRWGGRWSNPIDYQHVDK